MKHACTRPFFGDKTSMSFQRIGTVLVLLLTLVIGCGGREEPTPTETASSKPAEPNRRDIWLARAVKALGKIKDPEDRSTAAQYAVISLAQNGNYRQAKQLVQQSISIDKQPTSMFLIADSQSINGDLEQAIATANGVSIPATREIALAFVALRQAQCGNVDEAIALIPRIKEPTELDRVWGSVANAQAKAGDPSLARTTAAKIIDDSTRKYALRDIAKIKARKDPPLDAVDSVFIRSQLKALLLFSKSGLWRDNALQAVIVAKRENAAELDGWIRKTLTTAEKADEPAPATARLLLCVALAIADRPDEAKAMARRFLVAANGDIVGISDLFGEPVLAYLFTRLGMENELKKVLATEPGGFGNNAKMQAVGAADAEAGNWEDLERRYENLTSTDRVDFACGVLAGLRVNK
jgi:tetratricopeptide (TPR) repeat protein